MAWVAPEEASWREDGSFFVSANRNKDSPAECDKKRHNEHEKENVAETEQKACESRKKF